MKTIKIIMLASLLVANMITHQVYAESKPLKVIGGIGCLTGLIGGGYFMKEWFKEPSEETWKKMQDAQNKINAYNYLSITISKARNAFASNTLSFEDKKNAMQAARNAIEDIVVTLKDVEYVNQEDIDLLKEKKETAEETNVTAWNNRLINVEPNAEAAIKKYDEEQKELNRQRDRENKEFELEQARNKRCFLGCAATVAVGLAAFLYGSYK